MESPSRPAPPATRWSSQRGAVLIHVAIAMIGLLAFSALRRRLRHPVVGAAAGAERR